MTEEANAHVSTTGPGAVGGFGARMPGVVDIHRSGIADDVKLPAYQSFLIVAAISMAMGVTMAAFIRWYWVIDTFITHNMVSDFRPSVLYWAVVLAGFIGLCILAVMQRAVSITRDLPTLIVALGMVTIVTAAYAVFAAPILVFALRDWIVMSVSGFTVAVWIGVRLLYIGMTKKIVDPLTMEDTGVWQAKEKSRHEKEMYLLQRDDTNRIMQELTGAREELEVVKAERDELRKHKPRIRVLVKNTGSAVGIPAAEAEFDEETMSMFISLGFPPAPRGISRSAWVGGAAIREYGSEHCVSRTEWSRLVNVLSAANLTLIDNGGTTRALTTAEKALAAFTPPLAPYPATEPG